jgi:response regulator RpfG family c-di-GMP phosphodiesterase
MDEVKQVFVMTPHKDVFNSIRNWYREDFHSIYITKLQDIYSFIQKGIVPGLIIIDTDMEESVKLVSKKFRMLCPFSPIVVMPETTDSKHYDKFIQTKQADIILTKDDIFIGNRHILLLAYDLFNKSNTMVSLKKEIKSLNKLVQSLLKKSAPTSTLNKNDMFKSYMEGVFSYPLSIEKFYLNNHLRSTSLIIKIFCESLLLSEEQKVKAISANYFYNYALTALPEYFMLFDPDEMPNSYRRVFFDYYLKEVKRLDGNAMFPDLYDILKQVWEHYDGSGYPDNLSGQTISILSQIILVANKFHNICCRLTAEEVERIITDGSLFFDGNELANKFDKAKKYMIQNSEIFSPEIVHILLDNIKTKHELAFMVMEDEQTVQNVFYDDILTVYEAIKDIEGKSEEEKEDDEVIIVEEKSNDDSGVIKPVVKKGPDGEVRASTIKDQPIVPTFVQKLEPGDVIKHPIRHKSGSIVIKADTVLTEKMINTLNDLVEKHTINPRVEIANKKYEGPK